MDKSAKIEYNGKSYDFPIITGSENEEAIDINIFINVWLLFRYFEFYQYRNQLAWKLL